MAAFPNKKELYKKSRTTGILNLQGMELTRIPNEVCR